MAALNTHNFPSQEARRPAVFVGAEAKARGLAWGYRTPLHSKAL
ncbi:hypothetical protein GA0116948_105270 [Chitinophaga costaii]|uniref:Uncharacterized protein n=1 Tax=Chitinophaga costaii TaxID=1335309 RepID=A0A1C4DH29_9BACT|nr:hypothetical protein GA0116948_105270 [Chitinophaga costaii]